MKCKNVSPTSIFLKDHLGNFANLPSLVLDGNLPPGFPDSNLTKSRQFMGGRLVVGPNLGKPVLIGFLRGVVSGDSPNLPNSLRLTNLP